MVLDFHVGQKFHRKSSESGETVFLQSGSPLRHSPYTDKGATMGQDESFLLKVILASNLTASGDQVSSSKCPLM